MLLKLQIFVILIIIFCVFVKPVRATVFYFDDFSALSESLKYSPNGGSIDYGNSEIQLKSTAYTFPYVENYESGIFPTNEDYTIKFKFKYDVVGNLGSGLGIGFTNTYGSLFYEFGVWSDIGTKKTYFIYNNFNRYDQGLCNDFQYTIDARNRIEISFPETHDQYHTVEIIKRSKHYDIYLDKDINPNPAISTDYNQCIPMYYWFGNKFGNGFGYWSEFNLAYFKVFNGDEPMEYANKPVYFLIPGMGKPWT